MLFVRRQVTLAFTLLFVGTALCIVIVPSGLTANHGLSYFGSFLASLAPYLAANLGCAWFIKQAASQLLQISSWRWLGTTLRICAICLTATVFIPRAVIPFNYFHVGFAVILFVVQVFISSRLIWKRPSIVSSLLLMIQVAAGLLALFYLLHPTGYLLEVQLVFELCFWAVLDSGLSYSHKHFFDIKY